MWLKKMVYWGTKADELSIYALTDMLKIHTFLVTKHRPWTTIDPSVQGTQLEILHFCPVKLAFLGDNRFGRLWRKVIPTPHVSTLQTGSLPVFPDAEPLVHVPAPPTLAELETVETLLTMQHTTNTAPPQADIPTNNDLELQEAVVTTANQISELILENSPVSTDNQTVENLIDTMDKIVNHEDVSFSKPTNWLKFRDCMDVITGRVSNLVDVVNLVNIASLDVIKITPCRVELVRINPTPTVKLLTLQTNQDLVALGEYFTRSKNKPRRTRQSQRPRSASTNIDYDEGTSSSDLNNNKKKPKRSKTTSPADGPTASRVHAQNRSTGTPTVCLPPLELDKMLDTDAEQTSEPMPAPNKVVSDTHEPKVKGSFATRSFALKKTKRHRKYGCKLCTEVLDSAHLLTIHHQQSHGILYCDVCNKAFNNPTSLVRHSYQHKPLHFHCACGASFAFSSQLQTHSVVHHRHTSHHCVYLKCNRSFKNKGDLKRHAAEHYGDLHSCPDCDYKNSDVRNLESHRLKHSDINKYVCKSCGQGFKYNTQLRRHRSDPSKCPGPKRSSSPEF